ncbi:MAG: Tex family protein [Candidatus Promineifilaceae bacterium]|nr:Tex family protein [Candidatus Promineifilaceae bacterium]
MSAYEKQISSELRISSRQVSAVIELLDSGNTVPFIARYRKEATASLDEEQIREIKERLKRFRTLDDRRATIIASIGEQGKLTPELRSQIIQAGTATALEDLYQPYKPKRKTRAGTAREKGLQPLADMIVQQIFIQQTADEIAGPFLSETVPSIDQAYAGARDIVAETISDHHEIRRVIRKKALKKGTLQCRKIKSAQDDKQVYKLYYDFTGQVDRLRPHQVMAINRGESEKVLRVRIEIDQPDWLLPIRSFFRPDRRSPLAGQMGLAIEEAADRLLLPAIKRDLRRALTERAEGHAISVFARNLRGLLNQPPLSGKIVLAIDPAYRTGCKVAVIDPTGKLLETATIFPHQPQRKWDEALKTLSRLVQRHHVNLIAIGNGTASRETEKLAAELTRKLESVHYLIVNEAGASVYSASKLARLELPELDVSMRGAVSIGRRVLDPLAELVKIEPKSIGVGLYQHDVNQKQLADALEGVVESVVNQVGVDVNTSSPALLTYVSGIGPKLAERVVAHRDKKGRFTTRQELLNVNGLGSKAFEQSAGFLRINGGSNPLDASAIHPESYDVAGAVLTRAGARIEDSADQRESALAKFIPTPELAAELGTGLPTLEDICEQLVRPGRDPRQGLPPPILRSDVMTMDDLQPGMVLSGTVRNVVDFGAFIDVGVKQDGLLHRSQVPRSIRLSVGEIVKVVLLKVDKVRGRISLGWPDEADRLSI